jgi:tRNA uridine 5-carboxymethylaminomethyl modification enzyme
LDRYSLGNPDLQRVEKEGAEIDINKYSGYIQCQQYQIERQEHCSLSPDLDYAAIQTLSKKAREKLAKIRPLNIGQSTRIGGVNP